MNNGSKDSAEKALSFDRLFTFRTYHNDNQTIDQTTNQSTKQWKMTWEKTQVENEWISIFWGSCFLSDSQADLLPFGLTDLRRICFLSDWRLLLSFGDCRSAFFRTSWQLYWQLQWRLKWRLVTVTKSIGNGRHLIFVIIFHSHSSALFRCVSSAYVYRGKVFIHISTIATDISHCQERLPTSHQMKCCENSLKIGFLSNEVHDFNWIVLSIR